MKRYILTLLAILTFAFVFGQNEKLNDKWVKLDSINYQNILATLKDTSLLKNGQLFIKHITPFDTRLKKDLGFGLTLIQGGQYGGYVTAWVSVLEFKKEIIQLEIRYDDEDTKIIKQLIESDKTLPNKVTAINKGGPFLFSFINQKKFDKYAKGVADTLGQVSALTFANKDFEYNFEILTNPILNYEFGNNCYYEGSEPKGRTAINYFIALNDTNTIREIIKRYNSEGRLYAVEALLKLSKDKLITLTKVDKQLIQTILLSKILISSCHGCQVSRRSAKELINLKTDYPEENKIIEQENKIRKEQEIPNRKEY